MAEIAAIDEGHVAHAQRVGAAGEVQEVASRPEIDGESVDDIPDIDRVVTIAGYDIGHIDEVETVEAPGVAYVDGVGSRREMRAQERCRAMSGA
ncbi:hypothetical protein [Bradyrhizobium sp. 199]|uniref:hypothetical protein n=1 Tax=Bradyrhizobium sp. 199 TaxID=2782664 RepID=UPI001FFBEBAF|nr:hypothetical protein [Bradyrhizobium sp. 199]MCK1362197.1 hypothetical protein [Bradyrhizobium sp. 199]